MQQPLTKTMREHNSVMRTIAALVLLTFSTVTYSPAIYAAYNGIKDEAKYRDAYPVFDDLSASMEQLQRRLVSVAQLTQLGAPSAEQGKVLKRQLTLLGKNLDALEDHEDDALDYFEDQKELLKANQAAPASYASLKEKERRFRSDMTALQQSLKALRKANEDTRNSQAQTTLALVESLIPNRVRHSYDQDMPFGPLAEKKIPPKSTKAEMETLLGAAAPSEPVAADLSETLDIQFTPDIVQKAGELSHDPVQIFNWVYNNVQFIPSYGSIQGSGHTFDTLRGNAVDTASLTIAMLRSANVPARYQYGTVWLPIDQVMNWVGGVEVPESAQVLLSQGGIPDTLIKINGEFRFMELEHAWVEYWDGSQWIGIDPSFKQYQFSEGVDLAEAVPFDAETFADTLQAGATVNETEGWVQNVDQTYIQTEMDGYRQALEDFIDNQHPDATVGDILGDQQIIQRSAATPPAQLPYAQIRTHQALSALPDNLRHKFKFELQTEFGGTLFTHVVSTPEVAGKQLAFSFSPATPADEQALLDYLPENPENPEDLPSTIPANLFNVIGEFSIQGETVASSSSMNFGQELKTVKGLWSPAEGWQETSNPVITGEYQAIGLDLHGLSPKQMEALAIHMEDTRAKLEADDISSFTKHDVVGDLLQAGVWGYLAMTDVQKRVTAKQMDIVYFREPSYGTFQTSMVINYFFGVPQSVRPVGMLMDMDRVKTSAECKINCWNDWMDFNRTTGQMLSAYEHIIPEQLVTGIDASAEAISAVKALQIASAQGQKVYTITQTNLSVALPNLNIDQAVKNEIQSAVNSGKEVTVSQNNITYNGWTGVGYMVIDPETGAGAYKISGGADGGWLWLAIAVIMALTVISFLAATGVFASAAVVLLGALNMYLFAGTVSSLGKALDEEKITHEQFKSAVNFAAIMEIALGGLGIAKLLRLVDPKGIAVSIQSQLFAWNIFYSVIVSVAVGSFKAGSAD